MEILDTIESVVAEKNELDVLIDSGMEFTTPVKSILKHLGKKERKWLIKEPYAGTLDYISALTLTMDYDEKEIEEDPLGESRRLAGKHIKKCGEVVAIAVLNSKWKIKLFRKLLAQYFVWRITPSKILKLALIITQMSNYKDFITSIRLMSSQRTTKPNPIETDKKA